MRSLAEFVMRGRKQAIIIALLFTLIPLMGWVADAIVALVTLRKGIKEGAIVLLWVVLPGTVVGLMGYPLIWLYGVMGGTVTTYLLAILLRQYGWIVVLEVSALLGIAAVFSAHLFVPDIAQLWTKSFALYVQTMREKSVFPISAQDMQKAAALLVKIATGLQVALIIFGNLFSLLIARWAQAELYNPGGLRQELYNIRLGFLAIAILVLTVLASMAGVAAATDSLPVILLIFVMAGLSLVHAFVAVLNQKLWLVVFYGLLVVLFPYIMGMLVMLALMDSWWNFRRRFRSKNIA